MSKRITIDFDDYVGAVKLNSRWRFFYDDLSMWILDLSSYHPSYDPSGTKSRWREGLLTVDEANAEEYCKAMERELRTDQIPHVVKRSFSGQEPLTFVVNFDERIFVNGWHENIPIHDYAPAGWMSFEGDPYEHVPPEVRALWGK